MRIKVKLHPGSKNEKVLVFENGDLEVWIKEKPIEGKANSYLEKFLKREIGKSYKVVRGFRSRNKILEAIFCFYISTSSYFSIFNFSNICFNMPILITKISFPS